MPASPPPGRPATSALHLFGRTYGLAMAVHLLLADYDQPGWAVPRVLGALGAGVLLVRGAHAAGFALCVVTKLATLLLLRDVLTQSMLLVWLGALGTAGCLWPARLRPAAVLGAARVVVGLTYLLAALHKLNADFFNPSISCAPHAFAQAAGRWGLPHPPSLDPALPGLALGLEVALGLAVLGRSRWLWPLGVLFHLPLTVTLAPSFQGVMLVGWVASLTPRQRVAWRRVARGRGRWLWGAAGLAALLDLAFAGPPQDFAAASALVKVAANGALFAASLGVIGLNLRRARRKKPSKTAPSRLAFGFGLAWILHGLAPYLGLQYQHTGAMLSNLRIDDACHNSLIFGPGLRLMGDPYLRIDRARLGQNARPERAATLEAGLWSPAALHTMRQNWCVPELRPLALSGTHRGRAFHLPDLCAEDWLHHLPTAAVALPGYQAWQKNLRRECATACIH
jgi:hypothetical protein